MKNGSNGNVFYQIYSRGELNSTFKNHLFLSKNSIPSNHPKLLKGKISSVRLERFGGIYFDLENKCKYYILTIE